MAARRKTTADYTQGAWGKLDDALASTIVGALALKGVRADVRQAMTVVLLHCAVRVWAASSFPKREREQWSCRASAAFKAPLRELVQVTGYGERRIRNALRVAETQGLIVRLLDGTPRGEGRGYRPTTYAFSCHAPRKPQKTKMSPTKATAGKTVSTNQDVSSWGL